MTRNKGQSFRVIKKTKTLTIKFQLINERDESFN